MRNKCCVSFKSSNSWLEFLSISQAREDINLDLDEPTLDYQCEKQPLKVHNESPGAVDFISELSKGRFSVTANISHAGGKASTCKVFDKSNPEGEEASKREMKNLKTLRHERLVSIVVKVAYKYLIIYDTTELRI